MTETAVTPRRGKERKYKPTDWIDTQIKRAYQERADRHLSEIPNLKELAAKINWPHWAVKKRGHELGLGRTKEKPWSDKELAILERNAHCCDDNIRLKLKAAGFTRTRIAIHLKLKRTKLKQNTPYYSMTALAGLFGMDAHIVGRWIKFGYLKAKPKGTERTPQQGGDSYLVHHKDVREFVVEHPMEFDIRKVDQLWFVDLLVNKGNF